MKYRLACLLTVCALAAMMLSFAPASAGSDGQPVAALAAGTVQPLEIASPATALPTVKTVTAGGAHICAINQSNGAVSCWGLNAAGQLGDDTTLSRDLPVTPVGLGANVLDVAAGGAHTCAVTATGAVMCWGDASEGQLGDAQRTTDRLKPVQVKNLTSGMVAVAAGSLHTCALKNDGTVWCWGLNDKGQLGDDSTSRRTSPVQVVGLTNATAIAAGAKHTCATLAGGALKCWGANGGGQIGNGEINDFTPVKTPVDVLGLQSGVVDVTAGDQHTCAALNTGELKCWGKNDHSQLGIGGTVTQPEPTTVAGISVTHVSAGSSATCAALAGGGVACWGDNSFGQLGNGNTDTADHPQTVLNLSGVTDVAAGGSFACAVSGGAVSGGALSCWGDNSSGQLADGSLVFRAARTDLTTLSNITQLSAGYAHTCAVKSNGEVVCWGANFTGQLGNGAKANTPVPQTVPGISNPSRIAVGGFHTCAIVGFRVWCWGNNERGQIGDGSFDRMKLSPVGLQIFDATDIAAGYGHTCMVASRGVKCWGQGEEGQIGNGLNQNQFAPVSVSNLGPGAGALAVSAGAEHTCALLENGRVKCWGKNDKGQLGDGTTTNSNVPVDVAGITTAKALTVGGGHTCALLANGSVQCWGNNDRGQLGDATTTNRANPVMVGGLPEISAIAAGGPHTCAAAKADGALYCWGNSSSGELGNWGFDNQTAPGLVRGASAGVTALGLGFSHTCAELNDQAVGCWGWDGFGQLGLGTISPRLTPVAVQGAMPATLTVTPPNSGGPGSKFLLTGHRFAPGATVQFALNGTPAGSYQTGSGSFVVVLDTTGNVPGAYIVGASDGQGHTAATGIHLAAGGAVRTVLGGSVPISAPGAAQPRQIYLPTIMR